MKKLLKSLLHKFNIEIKKLPYKSDLLIEESNHLPSIDESIVNEIFDFFNVIEPFYSEDIRPELKIAGAWRKDFETRRTNQLNFIRTQDKEGYSNLIKSMMRNELIAGQWGIGYYDKKILNTTAPNEFLDNLKQYSNLTNHNLDVLDDGPFGGKWGVKVGNQLVTFRDPYKGVNAFNAAKILNFICEGEGGATYLDLGSGFGSDAIKVEKFSELPVRIILMDLPLNLTTAFAYVSMNAGKKCVLISNADQLQEHLISNFSESEFIFIPTSLVEDFSKLGIKVDLMYNHGSFSEMDFDTISYYIKCLLNGTVKALFEVNSNASTLDGNLSDNLLNYGGHVEVPSSKFPIPTNYKLVKSSLSINSYNRYVENLYIYK